MPTQALSNLSNALGTGDVRLSVAMASQADTAIKAKLDELRRDAARLAGQRAAAKAGELSVINAKLGSIVAETTDLKGKAEGISALIDRFGPLADIEFDGQGLVFAPPQAGQYVRIPMYDEGTSTLPAVQLTEDSGAGAAIATLKTLEVSWLDVMAVGIEFGRQDGTLGAVSCINFANPKVSGGATLLTGSKGTSINAFRMENTDLAGIRHYARVPKHSHVECDVTLRMDTENETASAGGTSTIFASIIAHIIYDNNYGKLNSPEVRAAFQRALGDVFKIGSGGFVFAPSAPPPGQLERMPMYVETADELNAALTNPCAWFALAGGALAASVFTKTLINDVDGIDSDFQVVGIEYASPTGDTTPADEVVCTKDFKVGNGPPLFPHDNWVPTLNYLSDEGALGGGRPSRGGLRFYPVLERKSEVRVDLGVFDASAGTMTTTAVVALPIKAEAHLLVHRLSDPSLGHKYGLSAHGLLLRAAQSCGCSF